MDNSINYSNKDKNPLCCIFNYNKNKNADFLYQEFSKYCTTLVLDSDSENPLNYFINCQNLYYTNLFNVSIQKFKEGDYSNLIIITSDVEMTPECIEYSYNKSKSLEDNIGVLQLQSDKYSRDYHNPWNKKPIVSSKGLYQTNMVEGFFNIISGDVVKLIDEVPLSINKFGVCLTAYYCRISEFLGKSIMIDTSMTIHHPNDKGYDYKEAHSYDSGFYKWVDNKLNELHDRFGKLDKYFYELMDTDPSRYSILNELKSYFKDKSGIECLEVGVFKGEFSKKIVEYLNPSKMFLVDIWDNYKGYSDNTKICNQPRGYFAYIYSQVRNLFSDKRYTIIRSNSIEASKNFNDESLDFIYIDANHFDCYNDLKHWFPKLKKGGVIAGHDYYGRVKEDVDLFFGGTAHIIESRIPQWIYYNQ